MTTSIHTVLACASLFVATHFILSHPLRAPLLRVLGEKGFLGLYSVVAALTLGATVWAYNAAPTTAPRWPVGEALWGLVTVLMLFSAILLVGSLVRNPALPRADGGSSAASAAANGVFAITRHPMMWAFAIWGACHILVYPVDKNIAVAGAILVLALVGAALQDRKKLALDPQGWGAWEGRTSFLPFGAIIAGRARLGGFGMHALGGGLLVWLLATWLHVPLAGWAAGVWRWLL